MLPPATLMITVAGANIQWVRFFYQVLQQEKCPNYPPDCVGGATEFPNGVGSEGHSPSNPPLTGGHPLFIISPTPIHPLPIVRTKGSQKTLSFLAILMGLSLTPIIDMWSGS